LNKLIPPEFWLRAYPNTQLHPFTRIVLGVSGSTAKVVDKAGDGWRVMGLARILVTHRESAIRHAAAHPQFNAALRDRLNCTHCRRLVEWDDVWVSAHHRTAANPLGAYGCVRCTQLPLSTRGEWLPGAVTAPDPLDLAPVPPTSVPDTDEYDVFDDLGRPCAAPPSKAVLQARARRVLSMSTPAAAMADLRAIRPDPKAALRALIRLHIELSNPPPAIRRLATERQEKTS
jgi:hypothetical protein